MKCIDERTIFTLEVTCEINVKREYKIRDMGWYNEVAILFLFWIELSSVDATQTVLSCYIVHTY